MKPQALLACEFGVSGNIATVGNAFTEICNGLEYCYEPKFNFSTAGHFGKVLESNGFVIDIIYDYDRPAVLKDGERGLVNWMK